MKRLIVLVLAIVSFSVHSQAQLLLLSGQSYDFEFSSLDLFGEDLTGINPPEGYNFATFDADVNRSTPGATFTVFLFENNAGEAPIATQSGGPDFVTAQTTGGWHDLQGVARVRVD